MNDGFFVFSAKFAVGILWWQSRKQNLGIIVIAGWFCWHQFGLRPRLVLNLPLEKCDSLSFGRWGLDLGSEVDTLCKANGITRGPLFVLKGKTAVRFLPNCFHGVHGKLSTQKADENTVYFYHYRPRYEPIVWNP